MHDAVRCRTQSNLYTVAALSKQLHQHPACGGLGLKKTKPFSKTAFQATRFRGSSAEDQPRLVKPGRFQEEVWVDGKGCPRGLCGHPDSPFNDDASIDVFPQRDQ